MSIPLFPFFWRGGKNISNRNKIGELSGVQQPNLPTVGGHRTKRENEW